MLKNFSFQPARNRRAVPAVIVVARTKPDRPLIFLNMAHKAFCEVCTDSFVRLSDVQA